jgi:hypothetical protein
MHPYQHPQNIKLMMGSISSRHTSSSLPSMFIPGEGLIILVGSVLIEQHRAIAIGCGQSGCRYFPIFNGHSSLVVQTRIPSPMGDLKSPKVICIKAFLFLISGLSAATLLLIQNYRWETVFLVVITVWSFCRLYYFLFYVIEHYVDSSFKYSGLLPMVKYMWNNRRH